MNEPLQLMLSLQDGVNSVIDAEWRERGNAWHRAIWMECAELLDREDDWKWWKAAPPPGTERARLAHDEQQQIELCDIWHFVLSWALEAGHRADSLDRWLDEADPAPDRHQAIEAMVRHAVNGELAALVRSFAGACAHFDLDRDRLFALYVGKNVVNRFRQAHGYKDGSYRKVFGGKEDNEHLAEILAGMDGGASTDLPDRLYEELARRYAAFAGG